MIQSYKQKVLLEDKYDSIIVGSGIGSLCTAALLSKEGKKVLVLERHYTAGGFTHVFKRRCDIFSFKLLYSSPLFIHLLPSHFVKFS